MNKKTFKNISRIVFLALLFIAPIGLMSYDDSRDFETAKNLDIFYSLFSEISTSYVDEIAPGDLMSYTINKMLEKLDPYTNYIPEADVERFSIMNKGEYGGIGASITVRDKSLMILDIRNSSPAEKSGLLLGDIIVEIDGHSIVDKPTEECHQLLHGQAGTTINIGILRNNQKKNFSIKRENIEIESIPYYDILPNEIGYIKLNEFSQNCSAKVLNACKNLKDRGAKTLILDLRDNPGGLLVEAIKIVNLFVPQGEKIVFTRGQNKTQNSKFSTQAEPFDTKIPLVVLVNENSASASEIVSGSLQDLDRAVIIGRQTFGKGLVQTRKELAHNCLLKITTSKYYIPSGRCIQKLDYTHKDSEGKPTVIPDSLQKTFYTRNNRPVKDGGGIIPDIILEKDSTSSLLKNLKEQFIFFDFVNQTYSKSDTTRISLQNFTFSDNDYQTFISFVQKENFKLNSPCEKLLTKFSDEAEKEHLNISTELSVLQKQVDLQQQQLFESDKELIKKDLSSFIIRTLYSEKGQLKFLIKDDKYIKEANKYLTNNNLYNSVLHMEKMEK